MKFMDTTFHPHLSRVYYERQGSNPGKPGFFKDIFLQLHKLVFNCDDHLCIYSIYRMLVSFG